MKKFFTLLMACALVLGANATAPALQGKAALPAKGVAAQVNTANLAVERSKARTIKAAFPHEAKAASVQAPARTANYTPVFDDCEAWGYDSYYDDGSWDLDFYNGEDYVGTLAIMGDCDATHLCGTYNLADAIDGYPGAMFIRATDTIRAVSGSFTITYVSQSGGVPTYHVSGTLVCTPSETLILNNDFPVSYAIDYYSYMLYYYQYSYSFDFIELEDAPFELTGDTIPVVIPGKARMKFYEEDNDFYMYGHNNEYTFALDVIVEGTTLESGMYSMSNDEFLTQYCGIYDPATGNSIAALVDLEASFDVTPDTTFIEAWYTLKDGNVYYVTAKNYVLTPTDTVYVDIQGELDDYTATIGAFQLVCKDSDYELFVTVDAETLAGEYTDEDNYYDSEGYSYTGLTVINGTNAGDHSYENYSMTVVDNGDETYTVTVNYLTQDAILYVFNVTVPGSTALENLTSEQKAQKLIENGQVIILKNGKRFNLMGSELE